jgi:hypothetical protein
MSKAAVAEESTPPLIPTKIRVFFTNDIAGQYRGGRAEGKGVLLRVNTDSERGLDLLIDVTFPIIPAFSLGEKGNISSAQASLADVLPA